MEQYLLYDRDQPVGEWLGSYPTQEAALAAALASESGLLEIVPLAELRAEIAGEQEEADHVS